MSDWCTHKNCTEMLLCILSLLRPPAGRELWDAQEALHVLVTSLAPMTEQGKALSPCAQEGFGFPLPGSSCPQEEAVRFHMRCCLSQQQWQFSSTEQ